jgi:hypothetical protein
MLKNGFEVRVAALPKCDLCVDGTLAAYDARTKNGVWGWLCEEHFARRGVGLGVGKGQRLIVEEVRDGTAAG